MSFIGSRIRWGVGWLGISAAGLVLVPSFCAALFIPVWHHTDFWSVGRMTLAGLYFGGLILALLLARRVQDLHPWNRLVWWMLGVTFAIRALLVAAHVEYRQTADCLYFYDFVEQMVTGGIHQENMAKLSHIWDYQLWFGRSFPLFFPLGWMSGNAHLLLAQVLNAVLTTATAGLVYWIGIRTLGSRPAFYALLIWCFSPIQYWFNLDYTHQIQGAFWFALGVGLLLASPSLSGRTVQQVLQAVALSVVLILLMLQRGLDILLWGVILLYVVLYTLNKASFRSGVKLGFFLVVIPVIFWGTARVGFQRISDHFNEAQLGSGLASIVVHGWNDVTGGEYYPFYEQVDRLTPLKDKREAAYRIIASKIAHEPVSTLGHLMLVKMIKFHLVGYASGIEQGLSAAGYIGSHDVFKITRLLYAPLFLGGALAGLLVLFGSQRLRIGVQTLIFIPVIACLLFAILGQTSPRYSFYTQFPMALFGGLAFSRLGRPVYAKSVLRGVFRWSLGAFGVLLIYGLGALLAFGIVRSRGPERLYQDLRKTHRENLSADASLRDSGLGALERDLLFPSGLITNGTGVTYCLDLPITEAREVSFFLWQAGSITHTNASYRCEVEWNDRQLDAFALAPQPCFMRKSYLLEPGLSPGRDLCIRLTYNGPEAIAEVDRLDPLRWGFVGLW